MVIEHTMKWDGKEKKPLSLSQIKQIAGRAGRFGLHGQDSSGGVVTTMRDADLPIVHAAIAAPMEPLRKARLTPTRDTMVRVVAALPQKTPLAIVPWVFHYVGKHHPMFVLTDAEKSSSALTNIDTVAQGSTLISRSIFKLAPIRWRDSSAMYAAQVMFRLYTEKMYVPHLELLNITGMMDTVNKMRAMMRSSKLRSGILPELESIHGTLVAYLWLHFRLPVPFADQKEVLALKEEIETAMLWCLEKMSAKHNKAGLSSSKSPGAASLDGFGHSRQKLSLKPFKFPTSTYRLLRARTSF